jgi:hypothetical protein
MIFLELLDENKPKEQYESFKQQQKYEVINGEVIEDTNIKEYNNNGEIVIEGNVNGKPILYTNIDNNNSPYNEFSKKVHFMDIVSPKGKKIVRTKTPYSKRRITKKRKMISKRKMTKKNNKKNKRRI